ncbi:MAG: 3-phosphoshikimate 1-carboxyvinyltransferase [Saprospiraceae bacterium]|jgi:3-phosphoshikimate 1-carboxyvinyltransferase|nr:3-phosphoshikimate 1-carboxyvinyltransferase [Saprospiraceae bacterium]
MLNQVIELPGSKSIATRLLVLRALGGKAVSLPESLPDADDVQHLKQCLEDTNERLYVGDGAAPLRFLLAWLAQRGEQKTIDGSEMLRRRPLRPLLKTLEELGCKFLFPETPYQLPVRIVRGISPHYPFHVDVDARQSSQFASALLLIAPCLSRGLEVEWTQDAVSQPYLNMTLSLMRHFGISMGYSSTHARIGPGRYAGSLDGIEADWSAAVFFLAWLSLLDEGELHFPNLAFSGLQADEAAAGFFSGWGLRFEEERGGMSVRQTGFRMQQDLRLNLAGCPDLFPALAVFCALRGQDVCFEGLQNLQFKESDRLDALREVLASCGVEAHAMHHANGRLDVTFGMSGFSPPVQFRLDPRGDHRLAMAFGLFAHCAPLELSDPDVVRKSFPGFWKLFLRMVLSSG